MTLKSSYRFSKVIDFQARWIGLRRSRRTAFSQTSKQNPSYSSSKIFDYSMKMPCACAYFNFEIDFKFQEYWINSQYPAAPQPNSSCLEIDHSRETATGSVKLGQHFNQICLKKSFLKRIQWHHQNWNASSYLPFINAWNVSTRLAGLCIPKYKKKYFKTNIIWLLDICY